MFVLQPFLAGACDMLLHLINKVKCIVSVCFVTKQGHVSACIYVSNLKCLPLITFDETKGIVSMFTKVVQNLFQSELFG